MESVNMELMYNRGMLHVVETKTLIEFLDNHDEGVDPRLIEAVRRVVENATHRGE